MRVAACVFAFLLVAALAQSKGDPAKGADVFADNCFGCHDPYSAKIKIGPGLKGMKDGKLPSGRPATHDTILSVINTGVDEMPAFKDKLTIQEKEDVTAYVLSL
jgi:cytochrome c6